MSGWSESGVGWLVASNAGWRRAERLFATVEVDGGLLRPLTAEVGRAELAQALNLLLFDDLVRRVPTGALYVGDRIRRGERVVHDHGAIRTVRWPSGELPPGQDAFVRILGPLGYEVAEVYPLDRLAMTGRAWRHLDHPETIAQFFVSELHPERFSPGFQEAVTRVLSTSREPLSPSALGSLRTLAEARSLEAEEARRLLPELLSAFDRQHASPAEADYERLLSESAEMAWIATEGNAFNHATDRVADVQALAEAQRRLGRPIKEQVEVSTSGRVLQTAYRAVTVERAFVGPDGPLVPRRVPGSFFEFITRRPRPEGGLDLGFDVSNAQAIFKMTAAPGAAPAPAALDREAVVAELRRLLGHDAVLVEAADLDKYERGWRYGRGKALAVARPGSTGEVSAVLALATRLGLRVVAQGANSGLVGASTPDDTGTMLVLSLERVARTLEVDAAERTVTADAGVVMSRIDAALAEKGLLFPIDLGADPTVGGLVSTNAGGTRLARYGDVRQNLLGLEVVLADGTVLDLTTALRKNNTGLDARQLFVGTAGVFGVVTRAVLRVVPRPAQRAAALLGVEDGASVLALLDRLEVRANDVLTSYEVMSAAALEPVFRHQPRLRNPFGASLPAYAVLVELSTTLPVASVDLPALLESSLGEALEAGGGLTEVFPGRPTELWEIRHHVSESLRHDAEALLALDLGLPRAALPPLLAAVRELAAERAPFARVCDYGHWRDGGVHVNLLWNEADAPRPSAEIAADLQESIYALAVGRFRGTYSAEHGVGPHNQRFYDRYSPALVRAVCRALKDRLDPRGLLGTTRLG